MIGKYAPCPIEYDETRKCWKVKLGDIERDCYSESEARLISNIPCVYEKVLNSNSSQCDCSFIDRLQQTVDIINVYAINCYITRKIKKRYKEISQKCKQW